MNHLCGQAPVDGAILLLDQRRVGGLGRVLLFRRDRIDLRQRFHQQSRAHGRQPFAQFDRGLLRPDFGFAFAQHIASVEPSVDAHDRHAGTRLAAGDGPLDRRCAAIFRQQRSVHVEDAVGRNTDDGLRDDLAIADHHHDVGLVRRQRRHGFGPPYAFGLIYGQGKAQRRLLHGRHCLVLAASAGTIRLRHDAKNLVPGRDYAFQRGNCERRRA